jgi:ketosteroid isomerase-like protein
VADELMERIEDLYARSVDRDPETLTSMYTEDVVIVQDPELPGTAGHFHGHDGVAAAFDELAASIEQLELIPVEVEDLGEGRVLVLINARAVGTGSGVPIEGKLAHLSTFAKDGRVARVQTYVSWERGREAAAALDT